jgi:hypothetical protein
MRPSRGPVPQAQLVGAVMQHCKLDGATMSGADLSQAIMHSASLFACNIEGAVLYQTQLINAELLEVKAALPRPPSSQPCPVSSPALGFAGEQV